MSNFGSIGQIQKISPENDEEIYKAEYLRFRAYRLPTDLVDGDFSFYHMQIRNGSMIPYVLYIRGRMVAGCYVSNTYNTLFIDQLFVIPELQESGLKLGRLLLKYVLASKDELGQMFQQDLEESALESINEKSTAIYKKEGYEQRGHLMVKKLR